MVGAADSTVSPSSSSTRRSTPCVLGCWGPMLTVIVSARMSAMTTDRRSGRGEYGSKGRDLDRRGLVVELSLSRQAISLHAFPELRLGHLQRLSISGRLVNLHRVVFAQRIPFPVHRHEQPPWIGMIEEHDPEQVPDLAFEPVRRRPDGADRWDVRPVGVQPHLEPKALPI